MVSEFSFCTNVTQNICIFITNSKVFHRNFKVTIGPVWAINYRGYGGGIYCPSHHLVYWRRTVPSLHLPGCPSDCGASCFSSTGECCAKHRFQLFIGKSLNYGDLTAVCFILSRSPHIWFNRVLIFWLQCHVSFTNFWSWILKFEIFNNKFTHNQTRCPPLKIFKDSQQDNVTVLPLRWHSGSHTPTMRTFNCWDPSPFTVGSSSEPKGAHSTPTHPSLTQTD